MADRYFKGEVKTLEGGVIELFGRITTTTLGVVGAQSSKGFSISKVGAELGRYRVTLEDRYNALLFAEAVVVGAPDAAYGATAGLAGFIRNVAVNANPPHFDIQFADPAGVDAEIADGSSVLVRAVLKNSTSF